MLGLAPHLGGQSFASAPLFVTVYCSSGCLCRSCRRAHLPAQVPVWPAAWPVVAWPALPACLPCPPAFLAHLLSLEPYRLVALCVRYECNASFDLHNVHILIPLPAGAHTPQVNQVRRCWCAAALCVFFCCIAGCTGHGHAASQPGVLVLVSCLCGWGSHAAHCCCKPLLGCAHTPQASQMRRCAALVAGAATLLAAANLCWAVRTRRK